MKNGRKGGKGATKYADAFGYLGLPRDPSRFVARLAIHGA